MIWFTCLLLLPAQIETIETADFPKQLQVRAVTATVRINNAAQRMEGTGVIVGRHGPFVYVLTAYHVVKGADTVEIIAFSEASYPLAEKTYGSAKVVAKAADIRDLALVRLATEDKNLGVLPICPVAEFPKAGGFPVLTIGCNRGQPPTCQVGKITSKRKASFKAGAESAYFFEAAESVAKGRSGGPLLDKRGQVIGICSGDNNGKGYYTHPEEIHRFLKQNVFDWLTDKAP